MGDEALKIGIDMSANTAGGEQSAQALEKMTAAAQVATAATANLAKETEALEKRAAGAAMSQAQLVAALNNTAAAKGVDPLMGVKKVSEAISQMPKVVDPMEALNEATKETEVFEQALRKSSKVAEENIGVLAGFAEAQGKTEATTNKLSGALGKAWGGFRMLLNIIPGLGMAGAIGLAVAGISKLIDVFKEAGDESDKLVEKFRAQQEVYAKTKIAAVEYQKQLDLIKTSTVNAADELSVYLELLNQQKSADDQLDDKKKQLEMVESRKKTEEAKMGVSNPVKLRNIELQQAQREVEIEEKYGKKKSDREIAAINRENQLQQEAENKLKDKQAGLEANVTKATEKRDTLVINQEQEAKNALELRAAYDKAQKEADAAALFPDVSPGGINKRTGEYVEGKDNREYKAKTAEKAAAAKKAYDDSLKLSMDLAEKLKAQELVVTDAKGKASENAQLINSVSQQSERTVGRNNIQRGVVEEGTKLDNQARRTELGVKQTSVAVENAADEQRMVNDFLSSRLSGGKSVVTNDQARVNGKMMRLMELVVETVEKNGNGDVKKVEAQVDKLMQRLNDARGTK